MPLQKFDPCPGCGRCEVAFADDFDRADGAPGADWTLVTGVWAIAANVLEATTADARLRTVAFRATPWEGVVASIDLRGDTVGDKLRLGLYAAAAGWPIYAEIEFEADDCATLRIYQVGDLLGSQSLGRLPLGEWHKLELCVAPTEEPYYGDGGGEAPCCEGADRPAELTAVITKNGAPHATVTLYFCEGSLPGNFSYTDDPDCAEFDVHLSCIQELDDTEPVFGISSEPELAMVLTILSCGPFQFSGSQDLSGDLWEVEITE